MAVKGVPTAGLKDKGFVRWNLRLFLFLLCRFSNDRIHEI
jgi:hypothetical protein